MEFYPHFNLAMDRSPGFGSAPCNYIALFRLAFASAPNLLVLNLAAQAQLAGPFYKKYEVAPRSCFLCL